MSCICLCIFEQQVCKIVQLHVHLCDVARRSHSSTILLLPTHCLPAWHTSCPLPASLLNPDPLPAAAAMPSTLESLPIAGMIWHGWPLLELLHTTRLQPCLLVACPPYESLPIAGIAGHGLARLRLLAIAWPLAGILACLAMALAATTAGHW